MRNVLLIISIALLSIFSLNIFNNNPSTYMQKKNYYCEYCGQKFASVNALTAAVCPRHPNGAGKGKDRKSVV